MTKELKSCILSSLILYTGKSVFRVCDSIRSEKQMYVKRVRCAELRKYLATTIQVLSHIKKCTFDTA